MIEGLMFAAARSWRLVAFTAISGSGWVVDTAIMSWLVHRRVAPLFANIVSASVALLLVFALSQRRVFGYRGNHLWSRLVSYALYNAGAVLLASMAINALTLVLVWCAQGDGFPLQIVLSDFGFTDLRMNAAVFAKVAVTPVTLYANFLFMAWLLGRKTEPQ